jgi:hypothetical protein
VDQKIARLVMDRYHAVDIHAQGARPVNWDAAGKPQSKHNGRFRSIDFRADVVLIAKRVLTPFELRIFRYRYLRGMGPSQCCRVLRISIGTFQYRCLVIEVTLGRAFRSTEPYALYPLDAYFAGVSRDAGPVRPFPAHVEPKAYIPLRPPLRKPDTESAALVLVRATRRPKPKAQYKRAA